MWVRFRWKTMHYTNVDKSNEMQLHMYSFVKNGTACKCENKTANYSISVACLLTHWGRDKKAATLADDIFKCIFFFENVLILIKKKSLNFVSKGTIDNNSPLVQVMAWHRTGDKPLPEPMMTCFSDAYVRHSAPMSWISKASNHTMHMSLY